MERRPEMFWDEMRPEKLTVQQLGQVRATVGRQLAYWDRFCDRMARRRWSRVDPVYRHAHEIRAWLRAMDEWLGRAEGEVRRKLTAPPEVPY